MHMLAVEHPVRIVDGSARPVKPFVADVLGMRLDTSPAARGPSPHLSPPWQGQFPISDEGALAFPALANKPEHRPWKLGTVPIRRVAGCKGPMRDAR
jgi:hypothetical protein